METNRSEHSYTHFILAIGFFCLLNISVETYNCDIGEELGMQEAIVETLDYDKNNIY